MALNDRRVTLCYQFNSEHYSRVDLNACVGRAVREANEDGGADYNIKYEDIGDGLRDGLIPTNIELTIQNANIVIFEVSDANPNVLYELGLAKGQNKKCILIRRKNARPLPFDVTQYFYLEYEEGELKNLHSLIAQEIKKGVEAAPGDSVVSRLDPDIVKAILSERLTPIRRTDDIVDRIEKMVDACRETFYYIGSVGLLTTEKNWPRVVYEKLAQKPSCRIIYPQSLIELHDQGEGVEYLQEYCFWLARFYDIVKTTGLQLYSSPEAGTWKGGMCLLVSDDDTVLVATGAVLTLNRQGVLIKDKEVASVFKAYGQRVAEHSTRLHPEHFGKYFSMSTTLTSLPDSIEEAIGQSDASIVRKACDEYVRNEVSKL